MNSTTQSIDIPKNKYYQETNTYPETTAYKINGIIVNKQIFYIIRQLCSQHNDLQEKVNEKDKEIERLNNVINEFDKWLLGEKMMFYKSSDGETLIRYGETTNKWLELKEGK